MFPASPVLADRFASILGGLLRVVAAGAARRPADQAVLVLFWSYLQRRIRQFRRLAERVHDGRLPPPRVAAAPAAQPPAAEPRAPRPRGLRLPSRIAWVLPLVPGSAVYGSQLQVLLAEPEMQALLAAAPQAARILRPLMRMLGTWIPPNLLPPPGPRRRPGSPGLEPPGPGLPGPEPLASGPPPAAAVPPARPARARSPGLRRGSRGTIRLGSFVIPVPS